MSTPTSGQLRADVASGELRFVIVGGSGGGPGGGATDATSWVTATCSQVSSVSSSLYDCSAASTTGD